MCSKIALMNGYKKVYFLDDNRAVNPNADGTTSDIGDYLDECDFFVGIGDNKIRMMLFKKIEQLNGSVATLIHPFSAVDNDVIIGPGSVVMAGSVINSGAVIGKGVIINTCSSVDHDCYIGEFSHIAVGTHLAGTVHVGTNVFIGTGAAVINNVSICDDVLVGACSGVIKSITVSGKYVGTPAKYLSEL